MREYRIDKINKTVTFAFDYDEIIVGRIKGCGYTARWNPEFKHWIVSVDDYSKDRIIQVIKDFNFTPGKIKVENDVKFSYSLPTVTMNKLKAVCDSRGFEYIPRDYQLESLGYALKHRNIINGDDVGLGKTFESIMYAESTKSFPCLVIVPSSVKYNWQEKWLEITGNKRSVSAIESKETKKHKNNWGAEVVVINYDIIAKKAGKGATTKFDELADASWVMVIFDEAHFLKNKDSQRSRAAKKIVKHQPIVQLLSGTVTMSRPAELWNLLLLADIDSCIANDWHHFITRYCGGYRGKFGWVTDGATNTMELNRKLRESGYLRREKREVLTELPDTIKQIIKSPITNQKDIDRATTDFIQYVRDTKGDESAEKAMEAEHLVALGMLRKLAIEGKLRAIEQYLKDWQQSGKKLLIFGIHREILDYLADKFKSKLIAGGVSSKKKQQIVKDWGTNDDIFLFANMQSAGTGTDGLQDICSNMLIIELPWRPSDLTQVIGRIDRSGQKFVTSVTYLLSDATIDNQMWQMLEEKEQVTEAVNKGIDVIKNKSGMKVVMKKIMQLGKKMDA